eukprot:4681348-Lingulodinium_polyedra.AAC.1
MQGQPEEEWFMGLAHLHDSEALVLKVKEIRVKGTDLYFFEIPQQEKVEAFAVVGLDCWEAAAVQWRSPWWQWKEFGHARQPGQQLQTA